VVVAMVRMHGLRIERACNIDVVVFVSVVPQLRLVQQEKEHQPGQ
jgi:hypothetical protein